MSVEQIRKMCFRLVARTLATAKRGAQSTEPPRHASLTILKSRPCRVVGSADSHSGPRLSGQRDRDARFADRRRLWPVRS